jgi:hypothetical protein
MMFICYSSDLPEARDMCNDVYLVLLQSERVKGRDGGLEGGVNSPF